MRRRAAGGAPASCYPPQVTEGPRLADRHDVRACEGAGYAPSRWDIAAVTLCRQTNRQSCTVGTDMLEDHGVLAGVSRFWAAP